MTAAESSAKGIAVFLLIAFGIAWGTWIPLLPSAADGHMVRFELYALPGAFAPALATFVVRKWITREGFADVGLALRSRQWRYYLVAWLLPLPVLAFIVLAAPALGFPQADFSAQQSLSSLAPGVPHRIGSAAAYLLPLQCLIAAPFLAPILFGEEFGWRGYLQLRLFAQRPTLAAIVTGIIWGLWHLPIILRGYEFPGDPLIATTVFCIGTIMFSIIFGWLHRRSGSIWVNSLAHSATNVIGGSLTALWFPASVRLYVGYAGLLSWIPLGLLCVWIILCGRRSFRTATAAGNLLPGTTA
ncbi:MAG TPA: type II CAAX endopeptidase family protein [Rhizomicrobium sp.]